MNMLGVAASVPKLYPRMVISEPAHAGRFGAMLKKVRSGASDVYVLTSVPTAAEMVTIDDNFPPAPPTGGWQIMEVYETQRLLIQRVLPNLTVGENLSALKLKPLRVIDIGLVHVGPFLAHRLVITGASYVYASTV
jgi:hypothetical protein